jgi:hypothetical protein
MRIGHEGGVLCIVDDTCKGRRIKAQKEDFGFKFVQFVPMRG